MRLDLPNSEAVHDSAAEGAAGGTPGAVSVDAWSTEFFFVSSSAWLFLLEGKMISPLPIILYPFLLSCDDLVVLMCRFGDVVAPLVLLCRFFVFAEVDGACSW